MRSNQQPPCQGAAIDAIPPATYSIVAHDPDTGEMGVAVQSHYFAVGALAPCVRPGVEVTVIQSIPKRSFGYGVLGIEYMAGGRSAGEALAELTERDDASACRQAAFVDNEGRVAAFTGESCVPEAGHRLGDTYSCQANMMLRDSVWDEMAEAYENASGQLVDRLMAALHAAEDQGGDLRGARSAAIAVIANKPHQNPVDNRLFDLRVEDAGRPLEELDRLIRLRRAYHYSDQGIAALAHKNTRAAEEAFDKAAEAAPTQYQLVFWRAVAEVQHGSLDEALRQFARVFDVNPQYREMVRRLVRAGFLPDDPGLIARIEAAGRRPARA